MSPDEHVISYLCKYGSVLHKLSRPPRLILCQLLNSPSMAMAQSVIPFLPIYVLIHSQPPHKRITWFLLSPSKIQFSV